MRFTLILTLLLFLGQEAVIAQKNTLEEFDYSKKNTTADPEIDYEEHILENGFFLDGLIQAATIKYSDANSGYRHDLSGAGLGFRLGNKWYFGKMKTYRPGIGATWGRVHLIFSRNATYNPGDFNIDFVLAPINLGLMNAFSFGGKIGLEANVNFGLAMVANPSVSDAAFGYLINPNLKFRYRSFAVGIDVTILAANYLNAADLQYENVLIGLTIGGKF
ncbi:hypothetical protein [Aureispira anguillae]|uniref:Outer membrane protein beta-barrel domain-containing protein n=1 Tax=Aureispira anguillae TaxID=2864201 RepID=A0A915YIT4_9BACT|nr:hypothetical protein [Aureispira anguillae]BDS13789.1 hypothetical protein AsAng_0045510 [Aureispira anguillae]